MLRRTFLTSAARLAAVSVCAACSRHASKGSAMTIAVGGKNLIYYLPLTIAERLGYFSELGLNVQIVDFAAGSLAVTALVGGSADVVAGAFEHTLLMQAKGQALRAFVLLGRAPQIVLAVSKRLFPDFHGAADLKGKRVGVTAPGSSTHMLLEYVLEQAGLAPDAAAVIGVGAGASAVAALRSGQVDALSNLDPAIAILERSGEISVLTDTRSVAESERVFGGPMPGGCLYTTQRFIDAQPQLTQALTAALVRADAWIARASLDQIVAAVPPSYLLGDAAVYRAALGAGRPALSSDGLIPEAAAETALRALSLLDPALRTAALDLRACYTNDFVRRAGAAP
jgi:NitT/TauT family transport system substrate-binding protein